MQSTQARGLQLEQWRHEREQRREQWNYEQDVEHARHQRDTLAELQNHLEELVFTARAIGSERMAMYRNATDEQLEAGENGTSEHYQELMQRFREARRHVQALGVRIESEAIRKQLDAIHRLADNLVATPPAWWEQIARADENWKEPSWEIVDHALAANKAIGTAIRTRTSIVRPD